MLKNANTYEIITPETVGLSSSELVLGKHSGRHAFKVKLLDLGYSLSEEKINKLFSKFKDLADKKKQIFEEDIYALVDQEHKISKKDQLEFLDLSLSCGSNKNSKANVVVNYFGKKIKRDSVGSGPIDAIFNAIKKIIPNDANLVVYQVNAITKGTDALAEVSVRLEEQGTTVLGLGSDIDTMVASAKAYVSALNKLNFKRKKA